MKKLTLLVILALAATVSGAAEMTEAPDQDLVAPWELAPEKETVPAAYCPYSPSCTYDWQCDDYCGTPGWGDCYRWCCACLG